MQRLRVSRDAGEHETGAIPSQADANRAHITILLHNIFPQHQELMSGFAAHKFLSTCIAMQQLLGSIVATTLKIALQR